MLDRVQGRGRLPSVVGAVVQDGRIVVSARAGTLGDVASQYRIGSITKTMTAVLVLQCHRDGLLELGDRLGTHLPNAGYGEVTLRALLTHTGGLQAEPVGPWWERSRGVEVDALLAANDGSGRVFAPGEAFHYSNLGFALLGEVVARLRGRSWADLVAERLWAPLEMGRTTYLPSAPYAQGYSVDHFAGTLDAEPHEDTGAMAPAGQVWSTLEDLARWLDFLAAGHPDVLDAEVIAAMAVPGAPGIDYGLGLRLLDPMVGHTGSMPGFLATAFVDRATRRGVVGFANATTGLSTDDFARELLTGTGTPGAAAWVPTLTVPPAVAGLLGLWFWGNTAYGLRWHNEGLELRPLDDPEGGDRFVAGPDGWRGTDGYLFGERLEVVSRPDGTPDHLECATFRFTRTPYGR